MWAPFTPRRAFWDLTVSNPSPSRSKSDAQKDAHELRLLNWLLPTLLNTAPTRVTKCESPDFEIILASDRVFAEMVDAIPDAVSKAGAINLAQRRSRPNPAPYHVDPAQFAAVITREIEAKRGKARDWVNEEPALAKKLVLLVNGGQAPLWLRDYFRDVSALTKHVPLMAIDPFVAVVLGDETGAFVAGTLPTQR
jgi:hypothetical protein